MWSSQMENSSTEPNGLIGAVPLVDASLGLVGRNGLIVYLILG